MAPIVLGAHQPPDRFYRGGQRIADFRGDSDFVPYTPEDWIGSTTAVWGHTHLGKSRLPDGSSLDAQVRRDPVYWLGRDHVATYGPDTKLLVKLLDAGQRLPVHAHPSGAFAAEHLGLAHGKAEAWYIMEPGEVFLGFTRDLDPATLRAVVAEQDIDALLGSMHRLEVEAHQSVYVPPGVVHAIGTDIFLTELQEPEDLSILLEWRDFAVDGPADGHLGLGFDVALRAVELHGRSAADIASLVTPADNRAVQFAAQSREYFRLDDLIVTDAVSVDAGFAVLVCLDGALVVDFESGASLDLRRGATALVPHADGGSTVRGAGRVLVARPPAP